MTTNDRALDRDSRAFACHFDGGYGVTDGHTTIKAHDFADAQRIAWIHNQVNGFAPSIHELRDAQRQEARS